MREHLIVLVESKGVVEEALEELHGLNGYFKDKRSQLLEVLVQRFNAIKRHWNVLCNTIDTLYYCPFSNFTSK